MLLSFKFYSILGPVSTLVGVVLAFSFSGLQAQAHAHHSATICSSTAAEICAHLGYDAITTADEAAMMLHFMPKAVDPSLITNVTVKLMMDMGGSPHGSSPVTLKQVDSAHIQISKAFFPMAGVWEVRIGFDYAASKHQLVIPLEVK
jgi:hypothetical protein